MLPPSGQIEYSTSSVPETLIPLITSPFEVAIKCVGFGFGLNYFASDLTGSKHSSTLFALRQNPQTFAPKSKLTFAVVYEEFVAQMDINELKAHLVSF